MTKIAITWSFVSALALCALPALASTSPPMTPSLVPLPAQLSWGQGYYRVNSTPRITTEGRSAALTELRQLGAELFTSAWKRAAAVATTSQRADLVLVLAPDPGANQESYRLQVNAEGIRLQAPSSAGLFLGLQTLRQLIEQSDPAHGIGFVTIVDAPRFRWRGLHLDVGRHLFPVDHIKRQIDLMARYKFNVLHWHLTEDQGWRLEIKRYPKLTEVGAWRKQTAIFQHDGKIHYDGKRYGGFYTQEQAREIVAYARQRHITVVPEIEMPGHTVAALAAYPELACTPGPFEVRVDWGVDDNVLCPSEQTFTFLEGVLDEVLAIFPSEYIHVGGDEAPIVRWQESKLAQDIIRREGLKDEHALQGWFMRRIESYLQQRGRRMLAWDEMLAGDPARSTTIMAWRSIEEGIKAARLRHDVVMTPTSYAYFDYCQSLTSQEPWCPGLLTLAQVYAFDPVPAQLQPAQARHVIGGQANLWTEHIRTPQHAEYMLWPRALAMAEVLWSAQKTRIWNEFNRRLAPQLTVLAQMGVNFRVPEVLGIDGDVLSLQPSAQVQLTSPLPDATVVYTTDGSEPKATSAQADGPITLNLGDMAVRLSARLRLANGQLGPVTQARYTFGKLQPAQPLRATDLQPGLRRDYFETSPRRTDDLLESTPTRSAISDQIGLPGDTRSQGFGLRWRGYLDLPADGVYRFALSSDDGSRLYINDTLVIDRDGPQSPGNNVGSAALTRGLHAFELRYFQGGGDKLLRLEVSRNEATPTAVPAAWLKHRP